MSPEPYVVQGNQPARTYPPKKEIGFFIWAMHYAYILLSLKDHQLYIGYSTDVFRRLEEHNRGYNSSTEYRRPLKMIYYEMHLSKNDAVRRERYFKTSKGKATLRQMLRTTLLEMSKEVLEKVSGSPTCH